MTAKLIKGTEIREVILDEIKKEVEEIEEAEEAEESGSGEETLKLPPLPEEE